MHYIRFCFQLIIGNYGLSYDQSLSQMAIWAVMGAPLIMSVDLRTIGATYRDILVNRDVIAINQDKLGIQGLLVKTVGIISKCKVFLSKTIIAGKEN